MQEELHEHFQHFDHCHHLYDDFQRQCLDQQIRCFMLDVAGNYPNHSKYKGTDWKCQACSLEVREDQEHLLVCDGYEDLRENLDLRMEQEMVSFYQRVMDRRRQMNLS